MTFNYENLAIGVDVEEIERFSKYDNDKDSAFLKKIFTNEELSDCFKTKFGAKRLAARYCAKEAVYKALCNFGLRVLNFKEIEIYHNSIGLPQVRLLNEHHSKFRIHISISNSRKTAFAQAIICKIEEKKPSIVRKEDSDGSLRYLIL